MQWAPLFSIRVTKALRYIHPSSLLARWSSGTANSGDFRGDSSLAQNFFLEGDSFPSLFDVPFTCLALSGVWNSGAHITVELEVGLGKACDVGAACYWLDGFEPSSAPAQLTALNIRRFMCVCVCVCVCVCAYTRTSRYWVVSLRPSILSYGICPRILHLQFGYFSSCSMLNNFIS